STLAVILFVAPSAAQGKPVDWAVSVNPIPRQCPGCLCHSVVGHGRRRKQAHDEDHDWIGIRRGLCNRCQKTITFLPALLTSLYPLQPYRPQRSPAALLCGGMFTGSGGAIGEGSQS